MALGASLLGGSWVVRRNLSETGWLGTMEREQTDEIGRNAGTKGDAGMGSWRNGRRKQVGGAGAGGEDSAIPMLHSEAPVPFTLMSI